MLQGYLSVVLFVAFLFTDFPLVQKLLINLQVLFSRKGMVDFPAVSLSVGHVRVTQAGLQCSEITLP